MGQEGVAPDSVTAMERFETFEHGADIGVRGVAPSLEGAFAQAARAVFSIMAEEVPQRGPREWMAVECASFDLEGLLVAWLNELISLAHLRGLLFWEFRLRVDREGLRLQGEAGGWPLALLPGGLGVEVKGATFTEAAVERRGGLWVAQCVVDV